MTDPGPYAGLLDGLPTHLPDLVRALQGLAVHIFWAKRYGLELSKEREQEVTLRTLPRRLARMLELDPAPLTQARPLERKLVSNCRDFSVMIAGMLIHQGVPARARCGFGTYFMPDHYEDHWVVEYWNADQARWVMFDPQLDELMAGCAQAGLRPAGYAARPVRHRRRGLAALPARGRQPRSLRHLRHARLGFHPRQPVPRSAGAE